MGVKGFFVLFITQEHILIGMLSFTFYLRTKNKRFTPLAVNEFQFSRSPGQRFPLADAVSIVLSGMLLLSAEEAFDVH